MVLLVFSCKEISYKQKVYGHTDTEHRYRGYGLAHAYLDEEMKQHRLQGEVDEMTEKKASSFAGGGVGAEGELHTGHEVEEEAHHVGNDVGHFWHEQTFQQQVDAVLNGCGDGTDDAEAQDFA